MRFVLGRLREACGGMFPDGDKLSGEVEIDECFVGGLEENKHEHKKLKQGRGSVGKVAVLGMRERGGRVHAKIIPDTGLSTIQNEIHGNVTPGSQLYTDEHGAYSDLDGLFLSPFDRQPRRGRVLDRMRTPPELDRIADMVLRYRPAPKMQAGKKRAKKQARKRAKKGKR